MAYKELNDEYFKERMKYRMLRKSHVNETTGCRIWDGGKGAGGYGGVHLKHRYLAAHRVFYEIIIGPIPDGKILMHKCDNPICIEPTHMQVGTIKENNKDMAKKGRAARMFGEDNPYSKLTEDDVLEIRAIIDSIPKRYRKEEREKQARWFGVTPACIYAIEMRLTWKDI